MEEEQTFENYMGEVRARINSLPEEKQESLNYISGTEEGKLLGFILGPRIASLAGETGAELQSEEEEVMPSMRRGLAAR